MTTSKTWQKKWKCTWPNSDNPKRQMTNNQKLVSLKLLHTLIWIVFNGVLGYLFYAAIVFKIDYKFWTGIGFITLEGLLLLIFKMHCPLTLIARKYSDSGKDNFDIFLPNWIARYNKLVYSCLLVVLIIIYICNKIKNG